MAKKEPDLTRVGECLWRHQSLKYYAIVRVGGKQFKRSLKTKDLALAKRKLRQFREKIERVTLEKQVRSQVSFLSLLE